MTASEKASWDSLSQEMKHAVTALATAWRSRRARRIEGSSPEVFDDEDDTTMETGSDDSAPAPAPPVHADFTMEQAQAHFHAAWRRCSLRRRLCRCSSRRRRNNGATCSS